MTRERLERAVRRVVVSYGHRRRYPRRMVRLPILPGVLSLARDIDTEEEARAIGAEWPRKLLPDLGGRHGGRRPRPGQPPVEGLSAEPAGPPKKGREPAEPALRSFAWTGRKRTWRRSWGRVRAGRGTPRGGSEGSGAGAVTRGPRAGRDERRRPHRFGIARRGCAARDAAKPDRARLLAELAERHPGTEFVVGGARRLRYPEFRAEVRRFARGLHALGVRRGDKVAILMGNRPEWLVADFAMSSRSAGSWCRSTPGRRAVSSPTCSITPTRACSSPWTVSSARTTPGRSARSLPRAGCRSFAAWSGSRRTAASCRAGCRGDSVMHAGEAVPESVIDAAEKAVDRPTSRASCIPRAPPRPRRVSSSSTFALIENMWHIGERQHLRAGDRLWLAVSPLLGLGCENALFALMTHAGTIVLQERFDAGEAIDLIEHERCTVVYATPNMVRAICRAPRLPAGAARDPPHRGHHRHAGTGPPPRQPRGGRGLQRLRPHRDLRELHGHPTRTSRSRCARSRWDGRFGVRDRRRGSADQEAPSLREGRRDPGPRLRHLRLLPGRGPQPGGVCGRRLVPDRRPRLPRRVRAALFPGAPQGDDQDGGHQRGAGRGRGGPDVPSRRGAGVRRRAGGRQSATRSWPRSSCRAGRWEPARPTRRRSGRTARRRSRRTSGRGATGWSGPGASPHHHRQGAKARHEGALRGGRRRLSRGIGRQGRREDARQDLPRDGRDGRHRLDDRPRPRPRRGARRSLVGRNQAKGEMRAAALRAETGNDASGSSGPTSRRRGTSAPSPGGSPRSCRVSTCS